MTSRPDDYVMVPSGSLLPGDVLALDLALVLGWADEGQRYEKLKVLTTSGEIQHRAYGRHFNLDRLRREGERR